MSGERKLSKICFLHLSQYSGCNFQQNIKMYGEAQNDLMYSVNGYQMRECLVCIRLSSVLKMKLLSIIFS